MEKKPIFGRLILVGIIGVWTFFQWYPPQGQDLIDAFKVLEVILVMTEGGPGLSTEILALRISRTATEFRELGVAASMSNYLLMLVLILTIIMLAYSKFQEMHAARLRLATKEES
mgnify:CR=1 FL=1